jgi:hypothetical protein
MQPLGWRGLEASTLTTWGQFRADQPDLAGAGRRLFYQFGVGLGFLATVRRDGGPRVHPVCPVITDDGLFAFIVPGPKLGDLRRDGRYALHSFPCPDNEDAFSVTGRASEVHDSGLRERVAARFLAERGWAAPPPDFEAQRLFELRVDRCLCTRTTGHGDFSPRHSVWPLRSSGRSARTRG